MVRPAAEYFHARLRPDPAALRRRSRWCNVAAAGERAQAARGERRKLDLQLLEELLLELQHGLGIGERVAGNQEHVLRAVAQRVNAGRGQVDGTAGEGA